MAKRNYNGEGTVFYNERLQRYVGQYTDPVTKKRKAVYDKDEKKLKKKLREAIHKAEDGLIIEKTKTTIPQLATRIVERKHEANITGSSAYLRALGSIKVIQKSEIGSIPLQEVTKDQLQDFFFSLKNYSNSYISKIYQLVKLTYEEAVNEEKLLKSPMSKIIKPKSNKQDKKIEALTLEEHQTFVHSLENEPYRNIFLIAINTGMRIGEILALEPKDIDFSQNIIKVSKTISRDDFNRYVIKKGTKTYAGTREIPFSDNLKQVLKNCIAEKENNEFGLLFSYDGTAMRPSTMNIVFKRICKNLNFKGSYNFHMLRHTFATRCIEAGMPAHVLQKLLGHTDVSITINTYTSIFDKYKKEEFDKYTDYIKANNL